MSTILDLYESWHKLNIEDVIDDAIEQTAEIAADLQREQMYAGKTSTGEYISPAYSPMTVGYKMEKGQPYDRVTLRDTGDFHAGQSAKAIGGGEAFIQSTDEKTAKLEAKYKNIFGLGGVYKQDYLSAVRPIYASRIEEITGLKLQ